MARYYGSIGFIETVETEPGVWEPTVIERKYSGDVTNTGRRSTSNPESINDNIIFSNEISIIADPYANRNLHSIRYAEYMGAKWKISNISIKPPRLILTMGGLYNVE